MLKQKFAVDVYTVYVHSCVSLWWSRVTEMFRVIAASLFIDVCVLYSAKCAAFSQNNNSISAHFLTFWCPSEIRGRSFVSV